MNEPPRSAGKTLGTQALAKRYNPMGGNRGQQRIKPSTLYDHVMTGEGDSQLLAIALAVDKLMPGEDHGLRLQQDLKCRCRIARADYPGFVTARDHVHVCAPFAIGFELLLAG